MEWISELFTEDVCNLLAGSAVIAIQNEFPLSIWEDAAARALRKRSRHWITFSHEYENEFVEQLERDPFQRVTSLVFNLHSERPELEKELREILPFFAYDDDSRVEFEGSTLIKNTPKKTLTKVMDLIESPRFQPNCVFTTIRGLQRVCNASESFLRRHIKAGILKEVSLMKGWKKGDECWIADLLSQKQLISFDSTSAIGVNFCLGTLKEILSTIVSEGHSPQTRTYRFRPGFGHRLEKFMESAGFEMPERRDRRFICKDFHRGNISIWAHHNQSGRFVLNAEYGS